MNWLLSIRHDLGDPATAVGGTNAPFKLINKNGLNAIITELKARGANADDQSCSIPKPTASIEYMRSRIKAIGPETDIVALNDSAINAWIGTLAVIVLSKRKNLFITEKNIVVSKTAPTALRKAVYDDFNALGLLNEENGESFLKLFSITQPNASYPIAVADKNCLIFSPINRIQPNLANLLGRFMFTVNRTISNDNVDTHYTECVWKNIADWTDFSEDDKLYLSSWIDGMLSSIAGRGMGCEDALKALNNYLKSSVVKYIAAVSRFGAGTGNTNDPEVRRWKSAWTYIALSKLYGEKLELDSVDTQNVNTNPCVTNWLSTTFGTNNFTEKFMHVTVKYQGKPIIKFCNDVGLYLYEKIENPQVWYQSGQWIDVFNASANVICPDFKSDLMWYIMNAANAFNATSTTASALNRWAQDSSQNVAPTDTSPPALATSGLQIVPLFGAQLRSAEQAALGLNTAAPQGAQVVQCFDSVIDMGVPVIFNKELVVFYDSRGDIEQSETINLQFNNGVSNIKALWPITPDMAHHVVDSNATLNFIGVTGDLSDRADNADEYITLNYSYSRGNRSVLLSQKYKMSDICILTGRIPYMTMWPYFLPNEDIFWKDYYVGLVNIDEVKVDELEFVKFAHDHPQLVASWQRIEIPGIKFVAPDKSVMDQGISGTDGNKFSWQILKQNKFPRFIPLSGRLGGAGARTIDIGCIAVVPPQETQVQLTKPATVGIDFGNSNTICAIAPSTGGNTSYSVVEENDTVVLLNGEDDTGMYNSLSRCWVPKNAFSRKFLTAVQLFNSTDDIATENRGILHGVVLFNNVDAIIKLYGNTKSNNVHSGLKAGLDANQVNINIREAASVFLSEIMLLCKLQARKLGCGKIFYHFSYPKSQPRARTNLVANLNGLADFINDAPTTPNISLYDRVFINEADAVKNFVVSKLTPANNVGYAIVDIGGGTTDFSIWEGHANNIPTCSIESSLRFAGNAILTDSILRVLPQGTKSDRDAALLRSTFGVNDDPQLSEWIEKYVNYEIPDGMQEADEKYLRLILDNIINKTGKINALAHPSSLRLVSHVRLKYLAAFFAIAKSAEAKGKITYPGSGYFNVYLAGGGSQCIDFASNQDCPLRDMVAKMFAKYVFENTETKPLIDLVLPENGMSKLEVASGLLHHYKDIDATVAGGVAGAPAPAPAPAPADAAANEAPVAQPINPQILTDMYNEFVQWCLDNHDDRESYVYSEIQRLSLDIDANKNKFNRYCIPLANDLYNTDDPYLFICKAVSIMLDPRF